MSTRRGFFGWAVAGLMGWLGLPKLVRGKKKFVLRSMPHQFDSLHAESGAWGSVNVSCNVCMDDEWFERLYAMLRKSGRVTNREDVQLVIEHSLNRVACSELRYQLYVADSPGMVGRHPNEPYWKKVDEIRKDNDNRIQAHETIVAWVKGGRIGPQPEIHYPYDWT